MTNWEGDSLSYCFAYKEKFQSDVMKVVFTMLAIDQICPGVLKLKNGLDS